MIKEGNREVNKAKSEYGVAFLKNTMNLYH